MSLLKKILDLLTLHERKRAVLLLGMILIMALLDMLGVASIMPFIAVLSNPELVETNDILKTTFSISNNFGVVTIEEFLFLLGILVFVLLIGSLAFKALTTYAQLRFTLMREYSIGKRLVESYLYQPYNWFLNRHSADLGKTILTEVNTVVLGGLNQVMNLIAQGAVASALLILLVIIDSKLALIVGFVLVAVYSLILKASSKMLARKGAERVKANQERFTSVSEAFGAAKEVKMGGLEQSYIRRFAVPAQTYARHQASVQVIGQLPRYALEGIAFGGMLLVVLYLMAQSGSFANAMPVIALYAFAGYRLIPALQQVYRSMTQLRFVSPALEALHKDLMNIQPAVVNEPQAPMLLNETITLSNVFYRYPNAITPALRDINLTIPVNKTVGLVGSTGSGKTTMVDLILGLLDAQEGTLAIDDQPITNLNKRAWQRSIGYVPQQVYLTDDTISSNIAFGVEPELINQTHVEEAAKIANLHEFVTSDLPLGYATTVGERGVRLSGGQRQRIGIARALYHNPNVLILDEATSALDNLTEQAVMDAVNNLEHTITIIIIAHRLNTVKDCDTIFLLEKGELKAQGTFDELVKASELFHEMAVRQ